MAKKRINVYVDEQLYRDLKALVAVTGDTVTSIFEEACKGYIETYEAIVASGDEGIMKHFEQKVEIAKEELKKALNK